VIEALLVLLAVALLNAIALLAGTVSAELVVVAGVACATVGMALGLPTGFWYHVRLQACLRQRGELPARWWLRPVALHARLRSEERPRVLPWFYLGGAGFVAVMLGCAMIVVGVLLEAFRAGVW
jgi:hypothetical protein